MALDMVTQSELQNELHERTGFPKGEIRHLLAALEEVTTDALAAGQRIKVNGVVIYPALKKASKRRKGRNPATGEEVTISAKPASVRVKARVVAPLSKAKVPSAKKLQTLL